MYAIVLSLIPLLSHAHDFEVDGNYYTLISTSEKTVRFDGTSNSGDLVIPETIMVSGKTFTIVDIKGGAFKDNKTITSVTVPKTMAEFEKIRIDNFKEGAAMEEGSFKKVHLPDNMTYIQCNAFRNCYQLENVNIPSGVKVIEPGTFQNCKNLKEIDLPKGLTSIGVTSFKGCESLKRILIPASVIKTTEVDLFHGGNSACFNGCTSLESIIFDDSEEVITLANIGGSSSSYNKIGEFLGCSIKQVYVGRDMQGTAEDFSYDIFRVPNFSVVNEVVYGDKCTSMLYSYLDRYHKPKDVNLFSSSNLKRVTLGKNLDKIYSYEKCPNLMDVYVRASTPQLAEGFSNSTYIKGTLYVPMGTLKAYQEAEVWKDFWNIVEYDVKEISAQTYNESIITPEEAESKQCTKPTISYENGRLTFNSKTEGATCKYTITDSDIMFGSGNEVELCVTYNISVYATKTGYTDSEKNTATLCWIDSNPKTEGITNSQAKVEARPMLIQSNNGVLTITSEGNTEVTPVRVYNTAGQMVSSSSMNCGTATINTSMDSGEIAIVQIGEKSVKMVLK